jgi:hypothetical protein
VLAIAEVIVQLTFRDRERGVCGRRGTVPEQAQHGRVVRIMLEDGA